jgi:thiamine biosynthesis lipoprotein
MMSNSLFFTVLCSAAVMRAASPALQYYEALEPHMGTMFEIKLYAPDEKSAKSAFESAFARVTELDNELSDYKPDSELNLATRAAATHPVHISNDLAAVLKTSQMISEETEGAFDVTVGPLTKLWRQARKQHQIPSAEAIAEAQQKCGYRKLHLDDKAQTITVDLPGMQLDLGAIAKGYAADEALQVINQLGIQSALVAASGDLAFSDAPPGEAGWKIGIGSSDRVLLLANAAVSTSGASEQYLESGGKHYSHIIDPATGMGLLNDITVTAISRHGLLADGVDTAVSVLGCEKGMAFVSKHPEVAVFISEKVDGQVHSRESTQFTKLNAQTTTIR